MFRLDGKIALVTGGSKGIGFGMAKILGLRGASLVIVSRTQKELDSAKKELSDKGIEAIALPMNVTNRENVEACVNEVINLYGRIDILINNAGMNIRKPLTEVKEDDWDSVLNTNLKGVFLVGQAVSKHMIKQEQGRIINVSSIFGGVGGSFQTSYAASKGGINQLTKVWADELAQYGITVNSIAPGYISTPMTESWLNDEERFYEIVNQTMVKRIGILEDLNGPIVFLSSDESSYITGQTLYVDGGWTAK